MPFRIGRQTDRGFDPRAALDRLFPFDFVGLHLHHPLLLGALCKSYTPPNYFSSDLILKSHGKIFIALYQ
jgi:hypothetical protein